MSDGDLLQFIQDVSKVTADVDVFKTVMVALAPQIRSALKSRLDQAAEVGLEVNHPVVVNDLSNYTAWLVYKAFRDPHTLELSAPTHAQYGIEQEQLDTLRRITKRLYAETRMNGEVMRNLAQSLDAVIGVVEQMRLPL